MAKAFQDAVLLFGDSLTGLMDVDGTLGKLMDEAYSRKLDVLNRGFGGYNTAMARSIFDNIFAAKDETVAKRVRLITLWWGTNDSALKPNTRHLSVEDFEKNMSFFFSSFTSPASPYAIAHSDKPLSIIFITPPALCPAERPDPSLPPVRSVERQNQFREAVLRLGEQWTGHLKKTSSKHKIAVIDLWGSLVKTAGGDGDELKPYYVDDVHLTKKGYAVLWSEIDDIIATKFKGRGIDWRDENDLPMTEACSRCDEKRCHCIALELAMKAAAQAEKK